MIKIIISGKQIDKCRFSLISKSIEIMKQKHPEIDWNSNDVMISVIPAIKNSTKDDSL